MNNVENKFGSLVTFLQQKCFCVEIKLILLQLSQNVEQGSEGGVRCSAPSLTLGGATLGRNLPLCHP